MDLVVQKGSGGRSYIILVRFEQPLPLRRRGTRRCGGHSCDLVTLWTYLGAVLEGLP